MNDRYLFLKNGWIAHWTINTLSYFTFLSQNPKWKREVILIEYIDLGQKLVQKFCQCEELSIGNSTCSRSFYFTNLVYAFPSGLYVYVRTSGISQRIFWVIKRWEIFLEGFQKIAAFFSMKECKYELLCKVDSVFPFRLSLLVILLKISLGHWKQLLFKTLYIYI